MKKPFLLGALLLLPASLLAQDKPLRLDELISRAREKNPKIQSAALEGQAAALRIPQVQTLPDPMIGLSYKNMGFPAFTLGQEVMSGLGLSFSQAVPFPGKLRLKGEIAEKESARQEEDRKATVLGVLKEVKTIYFQLYSLHKSLAVLGEQKALLQKASELTETKYAVGNGVQSEVFKARVEIARMDEMITPMTEMIKSLTVRLNLLMDAPSDAPLGIPQDQMVERLPVSLEEIKATARENSPMLKEASLMVEEGGKMVDLAKKELSPNFVFGGGYEYKGNLPGMYEIMVGVELPLYKKTKQSKMLEESLALHQSSKSGLTSARNDVVSMITESYLKAHSAETLIRLYKDKIIPQASLTVESSLAGYRVNKIDFLSLLADINTYFSYQLAYLKELTGLWTSIAELEEYSAKDIVKWGGSHEN